MEPKRSGYPGQSLALARPISTLRFSAVPGLARAIILLFGLDVLGILGLRFGARPGIRRRFPCQLHSVGQGGGTCFGGRFARGPVSPGVKMATITHKTVKDVFSV